MKRFKKALAILLAFAMVISFLPTTSFASTATTEAASANGAVTNLFSGSKEASNWTQVLTFDTLKDNGTFDPAIITEGGYFQATCTGSTEGVQMIFQSWSGGGSWAVVNESEVETLADGTNLIKFTYDDIVNAYGTMLDLLDRIYFNTTTGALTLLSLDYVSADAVTTEVPVTEIPETEDVVESTEAPITMEPPVLTTEAAESVAPSEEVTVAPVETTEASEVTVEPVESVEPTEIVVPTESTQPTESEAASVEPSEETTPSAVASVTPSTDANTINLFSGSVDMDSWTQGTKITAVKDGGVLDTSLINEDGYFAVSYTGSMDSVKLIFSSWSGGEGWATVSNTAVIKNAYKDYTAIFSYDTIAAVYGTDFDLLDAVYVMTQGGAVTLTSVDYVTSGVEEAIESTKAEAIPTVEPSYVAGELAERTSQADENHVKVIGRTYVDEDGARWITNSASGVEFTFTGTKGSVTVETSDFSNESNQARLAIYVNNELVTDAMMDEAEKTFEFFNSDETKAVTVRIIKLSESAFAPFAIENIDVTSTAAIQPTAAKAHKIEFIGDSITCGYGVDDEDIYGGFKTATENASKTYAYKTAEALGADYSMLSVSGYGVISGYTSGDINSASTMPQYYDNLGFSWYNFSDGLNSSNLDWNFDDFQSDAIVVNLGTNDSSYCGTNAERQEAFVQGYVDFLKTIRANNATATIFCTLGIMGQDLYPQIEEAVAQYTEETGDTNVTSMEFDVQQMSDGICVDWHPSETTHAKAASALTDYINYVMGW